MLNRCRREKHCGQTEDYRQMTSHGRAQYYPHSAGCHVRSRMCIGAAIVGVTLTAAGIFSVCQPTPESEIISQKENMQDVIGDYKMDGADSGYTEGVLLRQQLGAPETVNFVAEPEQGHIKFTANNVPVEIPETDRIGSAIISRNDFSEVQVKAIVEQYFRGMTAYEIVPMTKEDYLQGIERYQREMNEQKASGGDPEYIAGIEGQIRYYQEQMETAVSAKDIEDTPVSFQWQENELMPDMLEMSGENKEGSTAYYFTASQYEGASILSLYCFPEGNMDLIEAANISMEPGQSLEDYEAKIHSYFSENKCKYTAQEAVNAALDFLEKAGADTKGLLAADVAPMVEYQRDTGEIAAGVKGYKVVLSRGIGSVPQTWTQNSIVYISEGQGGTEKTAGKLPYDYERLELEISDDGVVALEWKNPMVLGEILADWVRLKPFGDILEVIHRQIGYSYEKFLGPEAYMAGENVEIGKITLGLMRIQNKDDEDNYTLIPVWDVFEKNTLNGQIDTMSMMTINAMDGSVIDRTVGY